MIVDIEPEISFTHEQKFQMVKSALQSEEGINAILEQTGDNFIEVIDRYKNGDDIDINMLMLLMTIAAGTK